MAYPFPKKTLVIPVFLIGLIWSVFLFEYSGLGLNDCYGVVPRTFFGLKGILLSPLFHSGFPHLISNTFPLFFLSFLTLLMYDRLAYYVLIFGWLLSGILLWLIGNPPFMDSVAGCHIGASGIVYMLASFILFSGLIRKERGLMAISAIVILLYGGMFWGVIPEELLPDFNLGDNSISWEGHLSGFIVGAFFAYLFRKVGPQKQKAKWEDENYYDPREEELWQKYLESLTPYAPKEEDQSLINKNQSSSSTSNM
ncbi:rhomboid family intramembrane serine protease [Faecalibacter macacae]|uniref:Rhomboid family intramembrane serine protease n=1 Tax=Faecalibacter macacae TaxID=1859289 RepID=A0A3L9MGY5_9FLAO|nr:rhomboid family intramembrane serine protease [Faecalibacter macacae]RLZ12015.1 rhomboid family intramembrane serine protease [Faecalibacter macacae]